MKKRRILFILLFFTSMLLTTTSYAWFTANRVVTINTLNVQVAAEGGIQVSTDAINWKAVLTLADIRSANDNYPNSKNQVPLVVEPVSTAGNIDNGLLRMFYGSASNDNGTDYSLTATRSTETESFGEESTGKFVAFDIFIKTNSPKNIYLSSSSGISYNGDNSSGIENAFRVAFLFEGNVPVDTEAVIAQNLNSANNAYIWEPNYDVHTSYGVENALNVYGIVTTERNGNLLPYDGIIAEIDTVDNVFVHTANANRFPNLFRRTNIAFATVKNFSDYVQIYNINSGITKIRIYIWVEGQDVDCENNASIGDINIDLQLTTNPS